MPLQKMKEEPLVLIVGLVMGGAGVGGGSYILNDAPPKDDIREAVVQLRTIGTELSYIREGMKRDRDDAVERNAVLTSAVAKAAEMANDNRADIRALRTDVDFLKTSSRAH